MHTRIFGVRNQDVISQILIIRGKKGNESKQKETVLKSKILNDQNEEGFKHTFGTCVEVFFLEY